MQLHEVGYKDVQMIRLLPGEKFHAFKAISQA